MPPAKRPEKTAPSIAGLRRRIDRADVAAIGRGRTERARRLLHAWLGTAERHGRSPRAMARDMRDGVAAGQIGGALAAETRRDPPPELRKAACAAGCAFCCRLGGPDGGTITAAEARAVHAALAPLAGQPDGRAWHADACPALDPETRACRIYEHRPSLCRSFLSTDARACEINADGGDAAGSGVMSAHLDQLAVLALSRAALKGIAQVPSYALAKVAAGAVEGRPTEIALDEARHPPRMLDDVAGGADRHAGRGQALNPGWTVRRA